MTRPRGRPEGGSVVSTGQVLNAALDLLEGGGQGLTMRALAVRLGVTPMSLYRHVPDHAGLLRMLSEKVYADVVIDAGLAADPHDEISLLLTRYYQAVACHPQLTLAVFATPAAFAGVTRQISDRVSHVLELLTSEPVLWRDILIDHVHGSALAVVSAKNEPAQVAYLQDHYKKALRRILACLG